MSERARTPPQSPPEGPGDARGAGAAIGHVEALVAAAGGGERARPVLEDLGLADLLAAPAADRPCTVPLADYFRLRHRLARLVGDETVQMSARALLPGSTDFVLSNLPAAGSLADTMVRLAKAYNVLHGGEYNSVAAEGDDVGFFIDDRRFPYTIKKDVTQVRFLMEAMLVFVHAMLSLATPGAATRGLLRVELTREEPAQAPPHLLFWRVPIVFGQERYGLVYRGEAARRENAASAPGPVTGDTICDRIESLSGGSGRPGEEDLVAAVERLILSGIAEQPAIAATLGVSVATLRRHLSAEGEPFRALRRRLLNRRACAMLREGGTPSDVAAALGFSDVRSFNRAFKQWNGRTPALYRADRTGA